MFYYKSKILPVWHFNTEPLISCFEGYHPLIKATRNANKNFKFFVKDFLNNYDFVGEKNFLYTRFGILRRFGLFGLICEL